MAKRGSEIERPSKIAEEGGRPGRAGHHEGEAGRGEARDLGNAKFNKEGRDTAGQKEAGKSRGPGG